MNENNQKKVEIPQKMKGIAFPKAKYGVVLAAIIIIVGNLIYYKDTIFSFLK